MRTIDVTTVFPNDNDVYVVSDDGKLRWNAEHTFGADWKDNEGQVTAAMMAAERGGEVVELEDGSDSYWFASMSDAEAGDFSDMLEDE